jgi:hypothetical protein
MIGVYSLWNIDAFAVDNIQNFTAPANDKKENDLLNSIYISWSDKVDTEKWVRGINGFILKIAKDFKNVVFALSTVVFIVLVYRLLFATNTDEEATKFRKWIIWAILGIVVMQLSYSTVFILFDNPVWDTLAKSLLNDLFMPLINLLLFGVSFAFIVVWIFAFYMIITAGGDDEKAKKWKIAVFYAVVGFVIIIFAKNLVNASYTATFTENEEDNPGPEGIIGIIADIINWLSPFTALVVVIMIIYVGAQLVFSNGDEDKLSKAKKAILFIVIWLLIIAFSYLIVTLFIEPDAL